MSLLLSVNSAECQPKVSGFLMAHLVVLCFLSRPARSESIALIERSVTAVNSLLRRTRTLSIIERSNFS